MLNFQSVPPSYFQVDLKRQCSEIGYSMVKVDFSMDRPITASAIACEVVERRRHNTISSVAHKRVHCDRLPAQAQETKASVLPKHCQSEFLLQPPALANSFQALRPKLRPVD